MQLTLKGPIDRWDEAIPLGNGLTGGLLWGEGNQIRLSLDRGGLWDNRPHPITQRDSWDYAHLKQWVAEGNIQAIREHFDDCYNYDMHPTKIPGGRLIIDLPGDVREGVRIPKASRNRGVLDFACHEGRARDGTLYLEGAFGRKGFLCGDSPALSRINLFPF